MTLSINAIIIITTLIVVLAMFALIPPVIAYVNKKNIPIDTVINSSKQITDIAASIVNALNLDPKMKGFLQIATETAKLAVRYAEQLYLSGKVDKEERKVMAFEFVKTALHDQGIEVSPEQESMINGIIEAEVFILPRTSDKLVSKKMD